MSTCSRTSGRNVRAGRVGCGVPSSITEPGGCRRQDARGRRRRTPVPSSPNDAAADGEADIGTVARRAAGGPRRSRAGRTRTMPPRTSAATTDRQGALRGDPPMTEAARDGRSARPARVTRRVPSRCAWIARAACDASPMGSPGRAWSRRVGTQPCKHTLDADRRASAIRSPEGGRSPGMGAGARADRPGRDIELGSLGRAQEAPGFSPRLWIGGTVTDG